MWGIDHGAKDTLTQLSKEFVEFQKLSIKSTAQMDSHIEAEKKAYEYQNKKIDNIIDLIKQGNEDHKTHSEKLERDFLTLLNRDYYTNIEVEQKLTIMKACCRDIFIEKPLYETNMEARDKQLKDLKANHDKDIKHLKTLAYIVFTSSVSAIAAIIWMYKTFPHIGAH